MECLGGYHGTRSDILQPLKVAERSYVIFSNSTQEFYRDPSTFSEGDWRLLKYLLRLYVDP